MRTIAIVNQKGGCGKTTTAISLAGALAARGRRVLLVDMDPQSHCATGLAIPEARIEQDVGDAMLADDPVRLDRNRLIWRVSRNLDLLPSRMRLAGLEASRGGLAALPDKDKRLARVLAALSGYDDTIIDCSPSIGLLTYNALCAAGEVLIPVETSYFAQQGAAKQVATLHAIARRMDRKPAHWILPTMFDGDAALPRELLSQLRSSFGAEVCPVVIRRDDKVREAATFGRPVGEYAPEAPSARDYADLAEWVLGDRQAPPLAEPEAPEIQVARVPAPHRSPGSHVPVPEPVAAGVPAPLAAPPPQAGVAQVTQPAAGTSAAEVARRAVQWMERTDQASERTTEHNGEPIQRREPLADVAANSAGDPTTELERLLLERVGQESFGVHASDGAAWVVQPLTLGRSISVAGEFNRWSPVAHPLRAIERLGVHAARIALPPGRHAYRLIVDGLWTADPFNPNAVTNPFGEPNSIIEIAGPDGTGRTHPTSAA